MVFFFKKRFRKFWDEYGVYIIDVLGVVFRDFYVFGCYSYVWIR